MSVRRSLVVLSLMILMIPALVLGWKANQLRRSAPNTNLQFYAVQRGTVDVTITALGSVEAEKNANLSFLTSGRVVEVLVKPGDTVAAGSVLARIDSHDEQIALERAELSLQLAQLQQEDLTKPVDEGDLRIAEAKVDSAMGAYLGVVNAVSSEDIQAAELRYQQAQQAEEDAVQARAQANLGQPDQSYEILDAQVGVASFNVEITRLQLESLQNSNSGQANAAFARVTQARKELDQVKAGPTQAEIDQAAIAVDQAQAQVDQAAKAVADMSITAPFDGVTSAVHTVIGQLMTPSMVAVELTDISRLHITVQVDEIDIRQIHEGISAIVQLDALPGAEIPAIIERLALVGTNDNGIISYEVVARLDGDDSRVRVGMTADASVIIEQQQNVLVAPNEYIRLDRDRGQAFVNVVGDDGRLKEIEVTLGLQGQDSSEIVAGLQEGDVVAVDLGSDRIDILGG